MKRTVLFPLVVSALGSHLKRRSIYALLLALLALGVTIASGAAQQNATSAAAQPNTSLNGPGNVFLTAGLSGSGGAGTVFVAVADFNGDGKLDYVTANNGNTTTTLGIALGNGDGTFKTPTTIAIPCGALYVATGDFNGDGKTDLAVASADCSPGTNGVEIFLGNGDGTFTAKGTLTSPLANPFSVAVGDFNGDGKMDLAVVDRGATTDSIFFFFGNGDGTYQAPVSVSLGGLAASNQIAAADFNKDGHLDVAVSEINGPSLVVILGNGNGTFQSPRSIILPAQGWGVAVGDFNGDGVPDLAATTPANGGVSIFLGKGDGNFTPVNNPQSGTLPTAFAAVPNGGAQPIAVGDFNKDGKLDIISGLSGVNGAACVSVLLGNGDGTLQSQTLFETADSPSFVAVADFNADGNLDWITNGNRTNVVTVGLGRGDGTFLAARNFVAGNNPQQAAVADFNKDGKLDLAVANLASSDTSILLGNGDGTFQLPVGLSIAGTVPVGVVAGDFNGDGNPDLIVLNGPGGFVAPCLGTQLNCISVFLGKGDGTFQNPAVISTGSSTVNQIIAGDFNGDGKLDIAFGAGPNGNPVMLGILLGNGDGTFKVLTPFSTGAVSIAQIKTADLNKDGKLDLVVTDVQTAGFTQSQIQIFLANGDGTFQAPTNLTSGRFTGTFVVADFNGDGNLDIVAANELDANAEIWLGNGNGTFNSQTLIDTAGASGVYPRGLIVGDFNLDGHLDIAFTHGVNIDNAGIPDGVGLLLGNGDGTFQPLQEYLASRNAFVQAAADFNRDGSPDLLLLDSGENFLTILLNQTPPPVNVSPISLAFGNQLVGTTSATQAVTVTNNGASATTIGVSANGDFSQTNTCPVSPAILAVAAKCTVNVAFKPSATGSRTGTLSVSYNFPGSPQTVALSGTGVAPVVMLGAANVSFGSQVVGSISSPQGVGLQNTGTATLTFTGAGITIAGTNSGDFSQTNNCGASVAVGANCGINITFKPTATGARSASLSINDDAAGSPQTVPLTGTGVAPAVSLSGASLSFGNQPVGTSSGAQNVTLTNSGNAALTISSFAVAGANSGDFSQTNACPASPATLAAGANCSISVTFKPTATGARAASVSITDNASGSPQSVSLSGTGTAAAPMVMLLPTSLSFGNQRVGTSSAAQNVTLTNSGNATLTLGIAITGANSGDFSQTNTCGASITAGANCSISATFKPTATGNRTASVTITDNASGSPHNVPLGGTGTAPAVMLSTGSLNFSGQLVTTSSAAQSVMLTNSGTATLNIMSIGVGGANSGDFSQTNTCGAMVAAAGNCSISVTFKPTATGNRTASVAITHDATGSPQTVTLTGTGTDFSIDAATGGSTTATVVAGQTATYKLQVTPVSGFSGTVSLTCSGAPSEATCLVSPASATPSGGIAAAFTATVTTTAPTIMLPRTAPPNWPPFATVRPMFLLFALALGVLMARSRNAAALRSRPFGLASTLALVLMVLAWAGACGGGGVGGGHHDPGTPRGTSTLTVTGTSGNVTRTQNLTLTVN
ncbi:MAG TPA: choice-of-anchor D domain-containing protein [Candidatus Acidoferrum sp.]|nr:choice-of-anchor D domain-containing protein [Candidatus Acidoferrum sp.]